MRVVAVIICLLLSSCSAKKKSFYAAPDVPPPAPPIEKVGVALVLGGGGARGLAEVGVLEVLEENNIPIDLIVGSSAGSVVGALYADHKSAKLLHKQLSGVKPRSVLRPSFMGFMQGLTSLQGAVDGFAYQKFLTKNLVAKGIEHLRIPLVVLTTDIERNELYLIRSGPIAPALHASSAIPPAFSPVTLYGRTLVDGGVLEPVPVSVAQQFKPKMIIAVNISNMPSYGLPSNMLSVTYKSIWLYYSELSRVKSMFADVVIHPDLDGFGTFEEKNTHHMIDIGRSAAEKALPFIKRKMRELRISPKKAQSI